MQVVHILERKLHVVKKQKELLMVEEAKLIRQTRQKKAATAKLAKVKREKVALAFEEARLIRVLKQNATAL